MLLSILIPTIPERKDKLKSLLAELYKQIGSLIVNHLSLGLIEVLIDDRIRFLEGGPSIGEKRGNLVKRASGKYLCFLDDDETIAPNYIEILMRACNEGHDLITFKCLIKNDYYWAIVDMSLQHEVNEEANPSGIIKRRPWHVCPMLSEYAKEIEFADISHNEDWDFMSRVLQRIQTENHVDMILLQYNHSEKYSEADKIVRAAL